MLKAIFLGENATHTLFLADIKPGTPTSIIVPLVDDLDYIVIERFKQNCVSLEDVEEKKNRKKCVSVFYMIVISMLLQWSYRMISRPDGWS